MKKKAKPQSPLRGVPAMPSKAKYPPMKKAKNGYQDPDNC